jgi:hypothetical protein
VQVTRAATSREGQLPPSMQATHYRAAWRQYGMCEQTAHHQVPHSRANEQAHAVGVVRRQHLGVAPGGNQRPSHAAMTEKGSLFKQGLPDDKRGRPLGARAMKGFCRQHRIMMVQPYAARFTQVAQQHTPAHVTGPMPSTAAGHMTLHSAESAADFRCVQQSTHMLRQSIGWSSEGRASTDRPIYPCKGLGREKDRM